uniref:Uncharacterized protein n=1 Tax=Arundo donax TaxID=35708 RepID=A0A0A8ZTF4_ARUDO
MRNTIVMPGVFPSNKENM